MLTTCFHSKTPNSRNPILLSPLFNSLNLNSTRFFGNNFFGSRSLHSTTTVSELPNNSRNRSSFSISNDSTRYKSRCTSSPFFGILWMCSPTKVGDFIFEEIFKPFASPRRKVVLPTPKSPKRKTFLPFNRFASLSPSRSVWMEEVVLMIDFSVKFC